MTHRRRSKLLLSTGLFGLVLGYYSVLAAVGWAPAFWLAALIVAVLAAALHWALGRLGFDPYGKLETNTPDRSEQQ